MLGLAGLTLQSTTASSNVEQFNAIVTIIIVVSNLSLLLFFCCLFFVLSLFFIEHYMFFVLSLFFIANCIYSTLHLHLQSGGSLFPGMVRGAIVAINDRHSNTSK